ncbi:MAG: hypothetical protein ABJ118_12560 [Luteolibacter sp.]
MFKKVGDRLLMAAAAMGGLSCPDCGEKSQARPKSSSDVLTCASCGARASAEEWMSREGRAAGRADAPPSNTKIRKEGDGLGGVVWHIPATGKFGFFLFFATFWLGITLIVSGGLLFTVLGGGKVEGDMPVWVMIPFFGIFYAVGFGMLYVAIRQKYMRHRLTVSGGAVTLRKDLLGRTSEKSLTSGTVKTVAQKEFYQQNYTPVYGIEIKGEGGKLRFGSALTSEEKAWLVADIHEAVFGPKQATAPAFHEGGARGEGKGVFSILIPGPGKGAVFGSSIAAVTGLAFLIGGTFLMDFGPMPDRSEGGYVFALVFALFDSFFLVMWSLISGAVALGGLAATFLLLRSRGSERRIEGNASQVSIRTYRRGLVLKDVSYARNTIAAVRSSVSGRSNGTPMKRVELIAGDKAVKLASWMDGEKADEWVAELRAALGL